MEIWVGGFEEEGLTEAVKGGAPWVGNGEAGRALKVVALRGIAKEAAVGTTNRAVCGFDIAMKEGPLAHVDCSGGIGTKGTDDVVGIVIIESA